MYKLTILLAHNSLFLTNAVLHDANIQCWFVVCSLVMFYLIALAGAHKRVVEQLREQLDLVRFELLAVPLKSSLL